jgi:light-regulated signal transduction histidine kinase (bacteriophytochrome)
MAETVPDIPWPVLTKFVSQLTHDLRNHLNAVELQAAFLNEIGTDEEIKAEIKRLREMTGQFAAHLQKLSVSLKSPAPQTMTYAAKEFVEDLRDRTEREQPELAAAIDWRDSLGAEAFQIDPQLLQEAFHELFVNAATHDRAEGAVTFESRSRGDTIEFVLREPKSGGFSSNTENWGKRPLETVRRGHYGLGLFRARGIFQAHAGTLQAQFDPAASVLITTVALPRAQS